MDPRIEKLAQNILDYSTKVKKGDKVNITCFDDAGKALVKALIKGVYKRGAYPYCELVDNSINRLLMQGYTDEYLEILIKNKRQSAESMDVYIAVNSIKNMMEVSDVPAEKQMLYARY